MVGVIGYVIIVTGSALILPTQEGYQALFTLMCLPSIFVCIWLIGELTLARATDLASPESGFPKQLFVLPIDSKSLVAPPMLMGTMAACVGWLVFSQCFVRPRGLELPLVWPALFMAALLAWAQAFFWRAFPNGWMRVCLTVGWLSLVVAGTVYARNVKITDSALAFACFLQIGMAYGFAWNSVAAARRGEQGRVWKLPPIARVFERPLPERFRSTGHAQTWFEQRMNGKSLPLMTLFTAILMVGGAFLLSKHDSHYPLRLVMALYWLPILLCLFSISTMSRFQPTSDGCQLTLFLATRPITTGQLVLGKFRAAAWTVLVTYLVVWIAIAIAFVATDFRPLFLDFLADAFESYSVPQRIGLALTTVVFPPVLVWWIIVNHLWIGLTGIRRAAAIYFGAMFVLAFLLNAIAGIVVANATSGRDAEQLLKIVYASFLLSACVAKVGVFSILARRLLQQRMLTYPQLILACIAWLSVLALIGVVYVWIFSPGEYLKTYLPSVLFVFTPGLGILMAPLVLQANRHRARG